MAGVIDHVAQLPPDWCVSAMPPMPHASAALMCPPDAFDIIDIKNPHMAAHLGRVDRAAARQQWEGVRAALQRCGLAVHELTPAAGCEDMVFCANPALAGLDAAGRRTAVLSRMRHASRQRETPTIAAWFASRGDRVLDAPPCGFEGGGDALWHPGRRLLWMGHGYRTDPQAAAYLAEAFGAMVMRLRLRSAHFYHLDTCLCLLDERTALAHAPSLEPEGLVLLRAAFERVLLCDDAEALSGLACNALASGGRVVLQSGNHKTAEALQAAGFSIDFVETGEFLKSGGSVYCMKALLF